MGIARNIYDWAARKAYSRHAPWWLALIFFFEMFVFLPMDALLILFCMHTPERRYTYAWVSVLSSLFIGLIGYGIGYLLWDSVGPFVTRYLVSPAFFERLVTHYNQYEYTAVFLGSLLPIPFKAITISAGFCQLSITGYIVALFFGRAVRFFLLAEAMQHFGSQVRGFVDRHFGGILVAFGAKLALTFLFFWVLGQ